MKNKFAFILAGGLGTRLLPYTLQLPKPLLPLGDTPILDIILHQLKNCGFTNITISLGYLPHLIKSHYLAKDNLGLELNFIEEKTPLGTAGALNFFEISDEFLLVMNGDILTNIDYQKLFDSAKNQDADLMIAAANRIERIDYGILKFNQNNYLTEYTEKPHNNYSVSMGIYVMKCSILRLLEPGKYDMPDFINKLINQKYKVKVFRFSEYWQDIGRPDDYVRATKDFKNDPNKFYTKYDKK